MCSRRVRKLSTHTRASTRPSTSQPVSITFWRAVTRAMSAAVASLRSAWVAPGQSRWKAKSESCGGAAITRPGTRASRSAASTASARFSAMAARIFAIPNSFTVSQTRRPGKPRERSGPCCCGS